MATWVRNNVSAINGNADSSLTGTVDIDNDTAPGDFDPANVTAVTLSVTCTQSGVTDDTFNMSTNEGWELKIGGGGAVLAAAAYDTDTMTGQNGGSHTASGTDNAPSTTATQAQWEGAEVDDGGPGNFWAAYVAQMKADGGTLDIAASGITVTITYTPSSGSTTGILSLLATQE